MLYREIIAVFSDIHTQHINALCERNVEFLNDKPGGTYSGIVDIRLSKLQTLNCFPSLKYGPKY
jgi:hypothetical protein